MFVILIYLGTKEATLNPLWNKMAEQGEREANKEKVWIEEVTSPSWRVL